MGRQPIFDSGMEAHSVADVRQIGTFRLYGFDEIQCFGQVEMRVVRFFAQGIHDQYFQVFQLLDFRSGDGLHVGQVREIPDAVTENLQVAVHDIDRDNFLPGYRKWKVVLHFDRLYRRRAGIAILGFKYVVKTALEVVKHASVRKNRHLALTEIERPDVIDPGGMVCMFVGEQQCIDAAAAAGQHLLAEIRAAVYHDGKIIGMDPNRYTKPGVARVCTVANRVVGADDRNALRSSRTQKINLQACYFFTKIGQFFFNRCR